MAKTGKTGLGQIGKGRGRDMAEGLGYGSAYIGDKERLNRYMVF